MTTATQEVGFLQPLEAAIALLDSFPTIVCKTKEDYDAAEAKRKQARLFLDKLDLAYKENKVVQAAKDIQQQKISLEKRLNDFNKNVKAGPMMTWENAERARIKVEEDRQAAILKANADAEAVALAKIKAEEAKKAEAEAKRLEKIAAEKAAAQKKIDDAEYARLKAEGDKKAAAVAKLAAEKAAAVAKLAAEKAAEEARQRAEAARQEQERIKTEARNVPAPTVVLEGPKTVSRRTIYPYILTTKDGRKFTKTELKDSDRIKPDQVVGLPQHLFMLDKVALTEFVDSQGLAADRAGLLQVREEKV